MGTDSSFITELFESGVTLIKVSLAFAAVAGVSLVGYVGYDLLIEKDDCEITLSEEDISNFRAGQTLVCKQDGDYELIFEP